MVTLLLTQEKKQYVLKKMVQKTGKIAIFTRKRGQNIINIFPLSITKILAIYVLLFTF